MDSLARFRAVQRLAYDCAETVAAGLEPGITEREAAARMRSWLRDRGVEEWFHLPFAWFGDRTAFVGFHLPHQFFPTGRRLEEGMPYILDVAPVVDGDAADIGYAGCLGQNAICARLCADLEEYRALVLDGVRSGRPLRTVYDDVDRLIERHGYINRHRAYPFGLIAHRLGTVHGPGRRATVGGFGVRGLRLLAHQAAVGRRGGWSPVWGPGRGSDHPPTPGLWAVEPHIGFRGVGVKFEEILVVTDSDAFWLDDDLPHVRRWRTVAATA